MQVGDYVIQQIYKSDINYFRIFKVLRICIDGYLEVEFQAVYNSATKGYYDKQYIQRKFLNHITTARIKLYHPTDEELFIFKQFKEQSC